MWRRETSKGREREKERGRKRDKKIAGRERKREGMTEGGKVREEGRKKEKGER